MSKERKLTVTKATAEPDSWVIENLTTDEVKAIREALSTAALPARRTLNTLRGY